MKTHKTVDEYIGSFPLETQKHLLQIRSIILQTAPDAVESISYRMPAFKLNGKYIAFFAAFQRHIGFYPLPEAIGSFKSELSKYKQGKGSVQFPLNQPMPLMLIKRIVKYKIKEQK